MILLTKRIIYAKLEGMNANVIGRDANNSPPHYFKCCKKNSQFRNRCGQFSFFCTHLYTPLRYFISLQIFFSMDDIVDQFSLEQRQFKQNILSRFEINQTFMNQNIVFTFYQVYDIIIINSLSTVINIILKNNVIQQRAELCHFFLLPIEKSSQSPITQTLVLPTLIYLCPMQKYSCQLSTHKDHKTQNKDCISLVKGPSKTMFIPRYPH